MTYFNKISKNTKNMIYLATGIGLLVGGLAYDMLRTNVRDHVIQHMKDTKKSEYTTKVGSCNVTLKGYWDDTYFKYRRLKLIIENQKGERLGLEDVSDNSIGRLRGLDSIITDGYDHILAENVPKDILKAYEKEMDAKLSAIEPELRDLAIEQKAEEKARKEREINMLKEHAKKLQDMCSE